MDINLDQICFYQPPRSTARSTLLPSPPFKPGTRKASHPSVRPVPPASAVRHCANQPVLGRGPVPDGAIEISDDETDTDDASVMVSSETPPVQSSGVVDSSNCDAATAVAPNTPAANCGSRGLDSAKLPLAPSVGTNEAPAGYSLDGRGQSLLLGPVNISSRQPSQPVSPSLQPQSSIRHTDTSGGGGLNPNSPCLSGLDSLLDDEDGEGAHSVIASRDPPSPCPISQAKHAAGSRTINQPRLCEQEPAPDGVIEISDDNDKSDNDEDVQMSLTSEALCDARSDTVFGHHCDEASQSPKAPRDGSALADARDMLLKRYSSHALSSPHKQSLRAGVGSSDLDGVEAIQRPGTPVPDPVSDSDPAQSLRQSDMLYHLSSLVARISSVEPDVTDQEMHVHNGTVAEEGTRPATPVDPNVGPSMSPSPASSPSSPSFPSIQSDSKGTSRTREDASSLETAGNGASTSNDPATPARPSQTLMSLLSPPKIKRMRHARPAQNSLRRHSARLAAAARNSPIARHERPAIAHSEANDDSCSEDDNDSDQSYTARSPDGAGEGEDGSLDEDDTPAPKRRRKLASPQASTRRRTPRQHPSQLSEASAGRRGAAGARTRGIASPPPSSRHSSDRGSVVEERIATYEEWPLQDAVMKRVIENGAGKFQFEFVWNPTPDHLRDHHLAQPRGIKHSARKRDRKTQASRWGASFSESEDRCLIRLKEVERLPWKEIHRKFTGLFPGRTLGSLQYQYSKNLRGKGL